MNDNLICYKKMPVWHAADIPNALLSQHNTQEGTWGRLQVSAGSLKFYRLNEDGSTVSEHLLTPESGEWVIQPQQWHKIEAQGDDLQLQLSFWCDKTDYFRKKYGMTATHSAVKEALAHVSPCKTLDLGCGQGRNALTLALLGFDVDACDYNPGGLHGLAEAAACRCRRLPTTSTRPTSAKTTALSSPPWCLCFSTRSACPPSSPICRRTPNRAATI